MSPLKQFLKSLILFLFIFTILQASQHSQQQQKCAQKFPRLFYQTNLQKTNLRSHQHNILIKFNTQEECDDSYVIINQGLRVSKFYCRTEKMQITQNKTFIQYIQNCDVIIQADIYNFNYTCVGKDKDAGDHEKQDANVYYTVYIPNPMEIVNIVVLADWGPIRVRNYTSVYPSFQKIMNEPERYGHVHAMMIAGDIAYDLNTNDCEQFVIFMTQLTQISPYWPIIHNVGNHQGQGFSTKILSQNFYVPELTEQNRVRSFSLWNLNIILFNPYLEIYGKSQDSKYQLMKKNLWAHLTQPSTFTILSAHYPIICSQIDDHCRKTLETMPDLYQQLSQSSMVDFYIGAHMHQYERIYPFQNNKFNVGKQSPYLRGMMVSVVQGIAGNDIGIIDEDFKVENFSAFHLYNKTGFGFMQIANIQTDNIQLRFRQYITDPELEVVDQFIISDRPYQKIQIQ